MVKHSRDLFIYSATQRHQSIRFYMVALAASIAGTIAFINNSSQFSPFGIMALMLIAIGLNCFFHRLDLRNRFIVKTNAESLWQLELVAKNQLEVTLQKEGGCKLNFDRLNAIQITEQNKKTPKYQTSMDFLFASVYLVAFIILVASLYSSWPQISEYIF